jgi:hypothetical protein
MMKTAKKCGGLHAALALALLVSTGLAQAAVPSPKDVLGHAPGDDYYLADYGDSIRYFHALAQASDHIRLVQAGKTTQGRTMEYAVISSPQNLARFEEYKAVSKKLADSRGVTEAEAKQLAATSKIIVHIDGGMHSSEVSDHQLPLALAHHLLSTQDQPETAAILDNVILVLWPTLNPDGQDMVVHWYRDHADASKGPARAQIVDGRAQTPHRDPALPWLYQEYVGHDNNRDGYMLNMQESQVVFAAEQEYAPAIWYSQHQSAPFPARIWMPPFADPISSNINPRIRQWTTNIGINMMSRFELEGKPGAIAQARFDNWYPGFLDYTMAFRHTIAYFTETAHDSATPRVYEVKEFPQEFQDLKAQVMYPNPWKGGLWRLKDSVDYMLTASLSTLETAVKYRPQLLMNRYQAARDTIARFSTGDEPRAWVIPAGQADAPTAALLAQKLIQQGVEVSQVASGFSAGGRRFAAGSYVIPMDQPFAGLVQELFERQKYPDVVLNGDTGKPVTLPYDTTGWTLPLQFGIEAVPVGEALPKMLRGALKPLASSQAIGSVQGKGEVFALSHAVNASFAAINQALAQGAQVSMADEKVKTVNGSEADAFIVSGLPRTQMERIAADTGATALASNKAPSGKALAKARIGLYRAYGGGNYDEGWTRWLLEQYHYAPTTLYNKDVRSGGLADRFDVLVIPDLGGRGQTAAQALTDGLAEGVTTPEYTGGIGQDGVAALKAFVEAGGTLVTFNKAADAAIELLDLPVSNVLGGLKPEEFFCSGALLKLELGQGSAATSGLPQHPTAMFERGPAFEPKAGFQGQVLARYAADGNPLLSGVLLSPERIQGKAAALEVRHGKGKVYLYGFRPQWRGQSLGTYKFVFNTLYVQR